MLEITLCSLGKITVQTRWIDAIGRNSTNGSTDLNIMNRTLTTSKVDKILRSYVVSYAAAIGDSFVLMHANTRHQSDGR